MTYSDFCNAVYNPGYSDEGSHTDHSDNCPNFTNIGECVTYYVDNTGCHNNVGFANHHDHSDFSNGHNNWYDAHYDWSNGHNNWTDGHQNWDDGHGNWSDSHADWPNSNCYYYQYSCPGGCPQTQHSNVGCYWHCNTPWYSPCIDGQEHNQSHSNSGGGPHYDFTNHSNSGGSPHLDWTDHSNSGSGTYSDWTDHSDASPPHSHIAHVDFCNHSNIYSDPC